MVMARQYRRPARTSARAGHSRSGLLPEIDLVAVEIAQHDAGAVGPRLGLAVEGDALGLEARVVAPAIVGRDREERSAARLAADQRLFFLALRLREADRDLLVVRRLHQDPAHVA